MRIPPGALRPATAPRTCLTAAPAAMAAAVAPSMITNVRGRAITDPRSSGSAFRRVPGSTATASTSERDVEPGGGGETGTRQPDGRWDDVGPEHDVTEHDCDAHGTDGRGDLVVGEHHGSLPGSGEVSTPVAGGEIERAMKPISLAIEVRRPAFPKKWSRNARSWHRLRTSEAAAPQSASAATLPSACSAARYASIGWTANGPDEPWPEAMVRRIAARSSVSEKAAANSGASRSSMSPSSLAKRPRLSATLPDPARDGSSWSGPDRTLARRSMDSAMSCSRSSK